MSFQPIGHIYDANVQALKEMASESHQITRYEEIPPIIRDAILAAEDKTFFHNTELTTPHLRACCAKPGSAICWVLLREWEGETCLITL